MKMSMVLAVQREKALAKKIPQHSLINLSNLEQFESGLHLELDANTGAIMLVDNDTPEPKDGGGPDAT